MLTPRTVKVALTLLVVLLSTEVVYSKTIKDVDIPEQITAPDVPKTLHLNGAGIRTKFFVSIYIGALYLPQKQHEVSAILQNNTPRRVMMYCLYDEISKQKLVKAWNEGFQNNTSAEKLASLHNQIETFNQLFPALHKGDTVYLDYIPANGTRLTVNQRILGIIPGEDFNIALLKIWLGDSPADSDLKAAMLGVE